MEKILVPLDGSKLSERALPYAATLAARADARVLLVQVAPAGSSARPDAAAAEMAALEEIEADLAFAVRRLRASGIAVEARVPYGPAARAIVDEARFGGVDLVVMSTHGRTGLGRWIYGSVADEVLRGVELPVLLVPPGAAGGWRAGDAACVVVPLDGSALAEEALDPAADLADALRARLVLLRVVEPFYHGNRYTRILDADAGTRCAAATAYLDQVAARLRDQGRPVEVRAEVGPPAGTIAAVTHELGAAAVALASHGRGGVARAVLGSVATGLLPRADAPILLVRPRAGARAIAQAEGRATKPGRAARRWPGANPAWRRGHAGRSPFPGWRG